MPVSLKKGFLLFCWIRRRFERSSDKLFSASQLFFANLPVAGFANPTGVPEAPAAIPNGSITQTVEPTSINSKAVCSPASPAPRIQKSKPLILAS